MKKGTLVSSALVCMIALSSCSGGNGTASTSTATDAATPEVTAEATANPAVADFMSNISSYTLPDALSGEVASSEDPMVVLFHDAVEDADLIDLGHGEGTSDFCYAYASVICYQAALPTFTDSTFTGIEYPWQNATVIDDAKQVQGCSTPAILQSLQFELYTTAQAQEQGIVDEDANSEYWCLSFVEDADSTVAYYFLFHKDYFTEEEVTTFAKTVSFGSGAFDPVEE